MDKPESYAPQNAYERVSIKLGELTSEEFLEIEQFPHNPFGPGYRLDVSQIKSREQRWLIDLLVSISPKNIEEDIGGKPWPKYVPIRPIHKSNGFFLILATDQWKEKTVLLKIPRRMSLPKRKEPVAPKIQEATKSKPRIAKTKREIFDIAKAMIGLKDKQEEQTREKTAADKREAREDAITMAMARLQREFNWQNRIRGNALLRPNLGYVPEAYEISTINNRFFISMEFVPGCVSLLQWTAKHNDREVLEKFLQIVVFFEYCAHANGISHCDISFANILIAESHDTLEKGTPVFLDWHFAKGQGAPQITIEGGEFFGNVGLSEPQSLKNPITRGPWSDIFTLGRILWILLKRQYPAIEGAKYWYENGQICYDEEDVSKAYGLSLDQEGGITGFDESFLPEQYRCFSGIFLKTQTRSYPTIYDFRIDLEREMYGEDEAEAQTIIIDTDRDVEHRIAEVEIKLESLLKAEEKRAADNGCEGLHSLREDVELIFNILRTMNGKE